MLDVGCWMLIARFRGVQEFSRKCQTFGYMHEARYSRRRRNSLSSVQWRRGPGRGGASLRTAPLPGPTGIELGALREHRSADFSLLPAGFGWARTRRTKVRAP